MSHVSCVMLRATLRLLSCFKKKVPSIHEKGRLEIPCQIFEVLHLAAFAKLRQSISFVTQNMIVALSPISSVNNSICYICIIYWQAPLHTAHSSSSDVTTNSHFHSFGYVRRLNSTLTTSSHSHSYLIRMNLVSCPWNIQIIVIFWVRKGEEIQETRPL